MTYLKWLMGLVLVVLICIGGFLFSMRFHDGPMEIFAGGTFKSGEVIKSPISDWSFARDEVTLEMQSVNPPRSRTTWLAVVDNRLFVPSGYMNTGIGKIWKHWPHDAVQDGRARLRLNGKIYPVQLLRVSAKVGTSNYQSDEKIQAVINELDRKYPGAGSLEDVKNGATWLFEIRSRKSSLE